MKCPNCVHEMSVGYRYYQCSKCNYRLDASFHPTLPKEPPTRHEIDLYTKLLEKDEELLGLSKENAELRLRLKHIVDLVRHI